MSEPTGTEIPHTALSGEALRGLVEEFVSRDGTDYGAREIALEEKVADVMEQLERGEVRIWYDPDSETATIRVAEE